MNTRPQTPDLLAPPRAWFNDPGLKMPTPLTVTRQGRVMGHLATWGTNHVGFSGSDVKAPRSTSDYMYFHQGTTDTSTGEMVRIGKITLGTGHAPPGAGVRAAAAHYDNSGAVVAVVRAGEDRHGVWVSGALVAGLSAQRVAELRRSPLSGDWRRVEGNLELVAALAVNTPGFPIQHAHSDAGVVASLTAAGALPARRIKVPARYASRVIEAALDDLGLQIREAAAFIHQIAR